MGARSLARLAAPLALIAAGCGPSAPTSFVAESTLAFHMVHLAWAGPCGARCDLEADWAGQTMAWKAAPAGAQEFEFELPASVGEMTSIVFRLRNVDGDKDHSAWVETSYLAGISPPSVSLSSYQMGSLEKGLELRWWQSSLADGTRVERFIFSPFDDPDHRAAWEEIPIPPGATSYVESRPDEWVDRAVFEYRVRSLAGTVESHPLNVASEPGPPAAPADVTAAVEGSTVRLSWTNRSRVATSISVTAPDATLQWTTVASLPPLTSYHVETGLSPGFHWYGIEAIYDLEEIFGRSGNAYVGALVPDPALEPVFTQGTVALPWADSAARAPGGGWALGSGIRGTLSGEGIGVRAPEAGGWALFESPPNRLLARPGPLVDPSGRVHAFLGPGPDKPELSAGPIVHVWREDGAWHEEQIGYAVSLLQGQLWAAAAPDGSLHALWRGEPGIPVASYATNRAGSWSVEQVPAPALPDDVVNYPLAVTRSGDAAVLLPAPAGGTPAFTLYRRTGTGWTAEPIPDEAGLTASSTMAFLAPSAERAFWLWQCGPAASMWELGEVCLRERTAAGWGPSEVLAQATYARPPTLAAVSPDGSRLAVALGGEPEPVQLFLVEGGITRSWSLPSASWGSAVGFDGAGKAWVLSGLEWGGVGLRWTPTTYALHEER